MNSYTCDLPDHETHNLRAANLTVWFYEEVKKWNSAFVMAAVIGLDKLIFDGSHHRKFAAHPSAYFE